MPDSNPPSTTSISNQSNAMRSLIGRSRLPFVLAILVLSCLVLAVFFPLLDYQFVDYDTSVHLLDNPTVRGLTWKNAKAIFLGERTTSSYYPVRALSYALDYSIWGLNPRGFKLTNILIHLANVLLVFWLVLRLFRCSAESALPNDWWDASVAASVASLFAVHPLVVEPVAWVSGREELLMVFWTLCCFHCYLAARKRGNTHGDLSPSAIGWYVAATLCCVLACLSNAVAAILPALVATWDILTLGRTGWRRILWGTAALWVIACCTIVGKKVAGRQEQSVRDQDAQQAELRAEIAGELGLAQDVKERTTSRWSQFRPFLVLDVFFRNVKSIVLPSNLAITYEAVIPRPEVVLLGLATLAGLLVLMWILRRHTTALFGLLWFGLALGPTAQIMPHHIHRADRFLYLPLVGLVLATAMSLRPLNRLLPRKIAVLGCATLGFTVLVALCVTSSRQIRTWQNSISMWENCLLVGPRNVIAHMHLADRLVKERGDHEGAYEHLTATLKENAFNFQALSQFAAFLATDANETHRDYKLAIRLASWAGEFCQWQDPEVVHTLALVYNNYAVSLGARGEYQQAIDLFAKAIHTDANYPAPLLNLALLRSACADPTYRNPEEAVRLAEQGCRLCTNPGANEWMILAMAYEQTGLADQAVAAVEKAVTAAETAGDRDYAHSLRRRLRLFRSRESAP